VNIKILEEDGHQLRDSYAKQFKPADFVVDGGESIEDFALEYVLRDLVKGGNDWQTFYLPYHINEITREVVYVGLQGLMEQGVIEKQEDGYFMTLQFFIEYIDCVSRESEK